MILLPTSLKGLKEQKKNSTDYFHYLCPLTSISSEFFPPTCYLLCEKYLSAFLPKSNPSIYELSLLNMQEYHSKLSILLSVSSVVCSILDHANQDINIVFLPPNQKKFFFSDLLPLLAIIPFNCSSLQGTSSKNVAYNRCLQCLSSHCLFFLILLYHGKNI